MKKLFSLIFICSLMFSCAFIFSACKETEYETKSELSSLNIDICLKNETSVLGYGSFNNSYTIDWNYNSYNGNWQDLSLAYLLQEDCEDDINVKYYYVHSNGYISASNKDLYFKQNMVECPTDITTLQPNKYYIFAVVEENDKYGFSVSEKPINLIIENRSFYPDSTEVSLTFDYSRIATTSGLVENYQNVNLKFLDIEDDINTKFSVFKGKSYKASEKLVFNFMHNGKLKNTKLTELLVEDIKVNAVKVGEKYYLIEYDIKNNKWLRKSNSAEVDIDFVECVKYTQLEEYKNNKYVEIPLYLSFNSADFEQGYIDGMDEILTLNLKINKAIVNGVVSLDKEYLVSTFNVGCGNEIKQDIDSKMIQANKSIVTKLYTIDNVDNIFKGTYQAQIQLVDNANICFNNSLSIYELSYDIKTIDNISPKIEFTNKIPTLDYNEGMIITLNYENNKIGYTLDKGLLSPNWEYINLNITDKDDLGTNTTSLLDYSNIEYYLSGSQVQSLGENKYAILDTGCVILNCIIEDRFKNKTLEKLYFNVINNEDEVTIDEKPYISLITKYDGKEYYGSNVSVNCGAEVVFEPELVFGGRYDVSAYLTSTRFSFVWGDNKPSGFGSLPYSYKFNKPGVYVVTIGAEYTFKDVDYTVDLNIICTVIVTPPQISWESDVDDLFENRVVSLGAKMELPIISAVENGIYVVATPSVVHISEQGQYSNIEVLFDEITYSGYYFNASSLGTYTVTYTATTQYNSISKSFNVSVGDFYEPTITIQNTNNLKQDLYFDGVNPISYSFIVDKTNKNFAVRAKCQDKTIYYYDVGINVSDINGLGQNVSNLSWDNLKYKLFGSNVIDLGNDEYSITGSGVCSIIISILDSSGNKTTKTINFNVLACEYPFIDLDEIYEFEYNSVGLYNLNNIDWGINAEFSFELITEYVKDDILFKTTGAATIYNGVITTSEKGITLFVKVTIDAGLQYYDYMEYIQIRIGK